MRLVFVLFTLFLIGCEKKVVERPARDQEENFQVVISAAKTAREEGKSTGDPAPAP
ncbi:MAG: hypothetical protein ACSHX6_11290 [Akkermansiaceae bacterium]